MPHDWDAATYDRLPIPMTGWGLEVLERLELRGDETVLDAGCGTGQVTEALRERLPRGHVIALDASPSMIAKAVERLGADRMTYLTHDLMEPIRIDPVDAILSTATFHWYPTTIGCSPTSPRSSSPAASWSPSVAGGGTWSA